jgi:hypothetical protein
MNQHHPDVQTSQKGYIQKNIAKVFTFHHDTIQRNYEGSIPKAGYISQNIS